MGSCISSDSEPKMTLEEWQRRNRGGLSPEEYREKIRKENKAIKASEREHARACLKNAPGQYPSNFCHTNVSTCTLYTIGC